VIDEGGRIGASIIKIGLKEPRRHHLFEEGAHALIGHDADAEVRCIARIGDAIFLHRRDRIGELILRNIGIDPADEFIRLGIVAVEIMIPADDRGIDETLHDIGVRHDEIASRLDRRRIGLIAVIGGEKDIRRKVAFARNRIGLGGRIALLNGMNVGNERG
jgi:hypothetical protein